MTSGVNSQVFVNRTKEIEQLLNLLSTGDALILGLAGIGKTALIEKTIEKLPKQELEENATIQIRATTATYKGWLLDRLMFKVYEQIELNKKLSDKIKTWFSRYGPDLYKTIKQIVETSSKAGGGQIFLPSLSLPTKVYEAPSKPDIALFTLMDQFTKQARKDLYIVIEDTHLLSENDKKFLTDLLSNHSKKVHILLSRRPQEKGASLFSSPEISYLMKDNRIVELTSLDVSATELLVKAYDIKYDPEVLNQITEYLRGNPYFLNLFLRLIKKNLMPLSKTTVAVLSKQTLDNVASYLQSQYIEAFPEFSEILNASSILPSNIHAEVLCAMMGESNCQDIQGKLLELKIRGLLQKDETFGGYRLFHPLLAAHIYSQLTDSDKVKMHRSAALYYQKKAKKIPSPLNMIATLFHAEKSNDKNLQFWALYHFAAIYLQVRRLKESQEYAEKALKMANLLKSEDKEFQVLNLFFELSQGINVGQIDQKLTRLKHLAKHRKRTKRNQIRVSLAEAYYLMGLGASAKAISPIRKCCTLAKQTKDFHNYLYFSHTLASLLADLHRYKEATEILRSCLEGFKKLNDQRGQMLVLQELGNVEIYSNPEKAIEYNKQAMRIAESLSDDLLMANSLHGIGVAYFELKQFTKAEKSFQKSLELTSKVGDVKGLIATYVELAGLMVQMKKLKKASRLIHKARELCEETNYFGALPKIELTEGGLLEAKGKMDEAKQKYLLASDLFKDAGDKVNAKYATKQATMIDNRPLAEWIFNVMNGRYKAELGSDGLTDSERRLNPFVGKKVRVVVNQGKWPGITDAGMRLVFEGTLCKEKVVERIPKWDKLMGHGKFNWWVQGKPVEGAEGDYANWMIAPIFVESITQIR